MKKTYMTPAMLAVMLLHQDNVLDLKTSILEVGSGAGLDAQVKEFEFIDDEEDAGTTGPRSIWDSEW